MTSDWQKGGARYAKLAEIVPEFLAPAEVLAFFVGVRGCGGLRLVNPFTPLQREYVIAATTDGVVVLRLRRPGVFRASIAGVIYQETADRAQLEWRDGRVSVDGALYRPISFHDDDAERVVRVFS